MSDNKHQMNNESVRTELELTADGSHTLFIPSLNEHYHSVNGAIQEAKHVFVGAALQQIKSKTINVFEVGFGTGLNALLTALDAEERDKRINYTTIEYHPIALSLIKQLNYGSILNEALYTRLHQAEWNISTRITENFALLKLEADFTSFNFDVYTEGFDVIYFDAFAPSVQDEMWTQSLFDSMYHILANRGILTTYCAKGEVRRMLQTAGFEVERLPGPPGKREMLRATKQSANKIGY